ncbi:replicase protein [Pelargonium ringspot virus]|nr:replicase protein [Pelargonium ringspot virus]AHZ59472.1 replicase protein [Pelargonium ringspot virus]
MTDVVKFGVWAGFYLAKELALLGPELASITLSSLTPNYNGLLTSIGLPTVSSIPTASPPIDLVLVNDGVLNTPNLELEGELVPLLEEVITDPKTGTITKAVKTRRPKSKTTFSCILAAETKNHFGGLPRATRANELSVMKHLVNRCKECKLTALQTREVSAKAFSLVFTPDSHDKFIYEFLNSDITFERRCDYLKSQRVDSCWLRLLQNPFGKKRWKAVVCRLMGMGVQEAYEFVK